MRFQKVKGTRDFYPQDMAVRRWLTEKWCEVSRRNGFVEYDGPTFEYLDLYTAKSGDQIVSELFHFEDRGGRKLALRPEMTPTLARMVAARANSLPKPIKWFCVPNFFRAEQPQRGRLREFFQWNVDIIGTPPEARLVADAECIFVALDFLREVGFTAEHVEMKISSRELVGQLLTHLGVAAACHPALFAVLDRRDKVRAEEFRAGLAALGLSETQIGALVALEGAVGRDGLEQVRGMLGSDSAVGDFEELLDLLEVMGVGDYCVFDMGVVRGLAYYTGVVFEAYSKGTLKRAICGGGRYDDLLADIGGAELPAVGFGMGDVILADQLEEVGLLPAEQSRAGWFVVAAEGRSLSEVLAVVGAVRSGLKQPCHYSYRRSSVKKQMQEAASQRARFAVILGEDLAVKDLETGQQLPVPSDGGGTPEALVNLLEKARSQLDGR